MRLLAPDKYYANAGIRLDQIDHSCNIAPSVLVIGCNVDCVLRSSGEFPPNRSANVRQCYSHTVHRNVTHLREVPAVAVHRVATIDVHDYRRRGGWNR